LSAFAGLRVVELGDLVATPYCGKLLADLGGEVIKVERPGTGDAARGEGPFPGDVADREKSGLFLFLNSNKLGVTANLETEAGRALVLDLVRRADVLLYGGSPSRLAELGLTYEQLRSTAPQLVVTAITPFGMTGPMRDHKANELVIAHVSGAAYMNPAEGVSSLKDEPPLKAPARFTDLTSGLTAGLNTVAGLLSRQLTGRGQLVDVSEHEAVASTVRTELAAFTYEKAQPGRMKVRKRSGGMLYRCRDGYFVMSATGEGFWGALVKLMGSPAWTGEPWCADGVSRNENVERVNALITEWAMDYTADEIEAMTKSARVPCSPVRSVAYLQANEQLRARGFFVEADHPVAGRISYPGAPYKLSGTPWSLRSPAPLLGEHNQAIWGDRLGKDVARLLAEGAI
jgi:crotonobetainyl-CoA:carnitine CoA-transferase CaiB-like acyl-CoA transferase